MSRILSILAIGTGVWNPMTKSSLETIHHLGVSSVSVWKVLGFAGSLALGGAVPLAAQTCLALPVDRNELWVAGGAEWGGQAVQGGALVAANIVDAVGIEWGVGWGGYEDQVDEDQVWSPSTTHVRVLSLLRLGTIRVCPFLEWRDHDRSIPSPEGDRFRDEVSETAYRIGAALGGDLPALLGTRLGWQATTGLVYRDWDLNGRRTLVDPDVHVEQNSVEEAVPTPLCHHCADRASAISWPGDRRWNAPAHRRGFPGIRQCGVPRKRVARGDPWEGRRR